MTDTRTFRVHPFLAITAAIAVAAGHATLGGSLDSVAEPSFGPPAPIGNGTARAFVEVNDTGEPTAIGVAISESALEGLPSGHGHHETVLELPATAGLPFRHVTIDWNPAGHEPPGIYDRPHFDIHFYTIPDQQRRSIVPELPDYADRGARLPDAPYRPDGYVPAPDGAVPMMGLHWVDPTSRELNGQTFTETLIYGSWDGRMIFIEPMLTRDWLLTRPQLRKPLPETDRVDTEGYWPTHWAVRYDVERGEYRIALDGMVRREAS